MKRKTANEYLSKYILLRDAIEDHIDRSFAYVKCRTCGKIMDRFSNSSHAGHFRSKGKGGGSGVYYDERNVHAQCNDCNKWEQGNMAEYYPFMQNKYGQKVIDELRAKHYLPRPHSIDEYGIMYRELYKALKKQHGLTK